jgi:DNA-binding HxlR family transcriptional regulator
LKGNTTFKESSHGATKSSTLGHCPITATLNAIGGKRKGQIWWRLSSGIRRFGELQRSIPEITPKMLTQQLRELERDGA